uniref:Uncharacterized protein n=1 Tax=Arundo donax TaxID=35708 RepID=A0A0A8ZUZ9_ARUDO
MSSPSTGNSPSSSSYRDSGPILTGSASFRPSSTGSISLPSGKRGGRGVVLAS